MTDDAMPWLALVLVAVVCGLTALIVSAVRARRRRSTWLMDEELEE